jgi:hypothetical protein
MSKPHVLIVGSAPDAELAPCDRVFFVNFSALNFSDQAIAETGATPYLLASSSALFPDVYPYDGETRTRIDGYLADPRLTGITRKICYVSKPDYDPGVEALKGLHHVMSPADLNALLVRVAGKAPPYLNWRHLLAGFRNDPSKALMRFKEYRRARLGRTRVLHSYFRPSGGLIALAYAVDQFGPDASYQLSGITMGPRLTHRFFQNLHSPDQWFLPHVEADRILLERLERQVTVTGVQTRGS